MNPILVGVDGSEQAMKAARMAADLAVACQAKLILVYVVPPIAAGAEWMLLPPDLYEELKDAGVKELRRAADVIKQPSAEQVITRGLPAEMLSQLAEERKAAMVVVGSHSRGAIARLLLGSVADRVAHVAHCPVLIVR